MFKLDFLGNEAAKKKSLIFVFDLFRREESTYSRLYRVAETQSNFEDQIQVFYNTIELILPTYSVSVLSGSTLSISKTMDHITKSLQ